MTFWNFLLLLLGVLLLCATICLMVFHISRWSVCLSLLTVLDWWLVSKFMDGFAPEKEE